MASGNGKDPNTDSFTRPKKPPPGPSFSPPASTPPRTYFSWFSGVPVGSVDVAVQELRQDQRDVQLGDLVGDRHPAQELLDPVQVDAVGERSSLGDPDPAGYRHSQGRRDESTAGE
ncbi:hypothetical protein [Kribbella sp. NPDC006257]|uniref:hypothetical protein n=1 Tax=Kribbella sp. NPDC006257 TaxID=3156738 RepID=UPI0033A9E206